LTLGGLPAAFETAEHVLRWYTAEILLVAQRLHSSQVHVDEMRKIAELVPLAHRLQRCRQPRHTMLSGQLQ
jgi:hypothetical protein